MGQLADLFAVSAEDSVRALRQALAGDDAVGVDQAAHALRGAAANLGATDLAALCARMSVAAATGDLLSGPASLETVEEEIVRVQSALDTLRAIS
jgi:HPt (histidine-containing phosphotransfer) domain-containing protein